MSDTNENNGFAAAGSGKSEAEVAFDLLNKLKGQGVWGERNIEAILNMYAECLDATKGLRAYPGQNRVEAPVRGSNPAAQAPAQQPSVQAARPATPAQPQAQPQAQAAPAQQPVQVQQAALQQAFKQG